MPISVVNESGMKFGWCAGGRAKGLFGTFIAKGTLSLKSERKAEFLSEDDMLELSGDQYVEDQEQKGLRYASDFALFKPNTDLLLTGSYHSPGGYLVSSGEAAFHVGEWSKRLKVVGDRVKRSGLLSFGYSEPEPFRAMPLTWERAYGGPSFKHNPCGKSLDAVQLPDGGKGYFAPNVEGLDPAGVALSSSQPAGFSPVPMTWPQRGGKVGTYGGRWAKERWPWYPDDFDWTFFNAAPKDQQLSEYLRGDEFLAFENLHPQYSRYRCQLPGVLVRWFLRERQGEQSLLREVMMRLDTLWVDMEAEQLVLVWRGVGEVRSLKMGEIVEHFIIKEPLASSKLSLDQYGQLLEDAKRRREEDAKGEPITFVPFAIPLAELPKRVSLGTYEEELAKALAAFESEMSPEELQDYKNFMQQGVEVQNGPPPTLSDLKAEMLAEHQELIQANPEFAKRIGPPPSLDEFIAVDEEANRKILELSQLANVKAADPVDVKSDWTRESVQEHAKNGGHFNAINLSGLDLSELDLKGVNFIGAVLVGVKFCQTLLDDANLNGSDLHEADLSFCSLKSATLISTDLTNANLANAVLDGAELSNSELAKASLTSASLLQVQALRTNFSGADLTLANMNAGCFSNSDFTGAKLENASFVRALLQNADFDSVTALEIDLSGADLTKLRASGANLSKGKLVGVTAGASIWDEAILDCADFSRAQMGLANFTGASLKQAVFVETNLVRARLSEAQCQRVKLVRSNLFRATLENAFLQEADCTGSNFFEVEFYGAITNGADFSRSNMKRTKLA